MNLEDKIEIVKNIFCNRNVFLFFRHLKTPSFFIKDRIGKAIKKIFAVCRVGGGFMPNYFSYDGVQRNTVNVSDNPTSCLKALDNSCGR